MKRLMVVLATVSVLSIGSAAAALAQTPTPPGNQGQPGWGCGGLEGDYGNYDPSNDPTLKRLADKVGIGAKDLASELQAGKSVAEVAKTKNVTEDALVDVLLAPQVETLKLRVKYGYLTQSQADSLQKSMAERAKTQLNQKGFFGFGMMGGGMMGGASGMMGGASGMMGGASGTMGGASGMMGGASGMMGRGFSGSSFRGSSY